MKQFFKITSFKIVLSLAIVILIVAGVFLYNNSRIVTEQGVEVKTNFLVKVLHQFSDIILFPVRTINTPIAKIFLRNYDSGTEIDLSNPIINYGWLLFLLLFLIPLLIEVYIISCMFSYLRNKLKIKKPNNNK